MNALRLKENLEKYTRIESCPVRNVLARFSGKWAILILCVLSENEKTRFNEISKAIPDISSKVLTHKTLKKYQIKGYTVNQRFERLEYGMANTEEQIGLLINSSLPPTEGIFFEGEVFDAYTWLNKRNGETLEQPNPQMPDEINDLEGA